MSTPHLSTETGKCYLRTIPFPFHEYAFQQLGRNPTQVHVLNFIDTLDFQEAHSMDFYSTALVDASLTKTESGFQAHVWFSNSGLPPTELLNLLPTNCKIGARVTGYPVIRSVASAKKLGLIHLIILALILYLCIDKYTQLVQKEHHSHNTERHQYRHLKPHLQKATENKLKKLLTTTLTLKEISEISDLPAQIILNYALSVPQGYEESYLDTYAYCWTRAFRNDTQLAIAMDSPGFVTYHQLALVYMLNFKEVVPSSLTPGHLSVTDVNLTPLQLPILIIVEAIVAINGYRLFLYRKAHWKQLLIALLLKLVLLGPTQYLAITQYAKAS